MQISTSGPEVVGNRYLRDTITNRLMRTMTRFSIEFNGSTLLSLRRTVREAASIMHCGILVYIFNVELYVATAKDEGRWAAVSRATTRGRK